MAKDPLNISLPEGVCDSHVHVGSFPILQARFDMYQMIRFMDKYKLQNVLVSSSPYGEITNSFSHHNSNRVTKKLIQLSKEDPRVWVLLRSRIESYTQTRYLKWFEKALDEPQVVGMKVNPSQEGYKILDVRYQQVLQILNDKEGVLLLHCGRWQERSGWNKGILTAGMYPKMKVILAHMGGTHPELAYPAIDKALPLKNVYMNTSQTRNTGIIRQGVKTLGADRILFGSDTPWGNYVQNLIGILQLGLSEKEQHQILVGNFERTIKNE